MRNKYKAKYIVYRSEKCKKCHKNENKNWRIAAVGNQLFLCSKSGVDIHDIHREHHRHLSFCMEYFVFLHHVPFVRFSINYFTFRMLYMNMYLI